MKRIICLFLVLIIGFSLSACGNIKNATDTTTTKNDFETDQPVTSTVTEQQITLKECIYNSREINYNSHHVEINIYTDEHYYFTNRNREFYTDLMRFLEKSINVTDAEYQNDPEIYDYYISMLDHNFERAYIQIYKNDTINTNGKTYYSKGIYEELKSMLKPHLEEYNKYCKSAHTTVRLQYEYVIFGEDYKLLESDFNSKTPHLFYSDGIVHFWMQTGTGQLSRFAYFYDVKTGEKSPDYSGQTDFYKNIVCSVSHSSIYFYDMFTGKELYVINEFEKPLLDGMENVQSAYFTLDGTQVIVEYLNTDCQTETQIFDFPQELYTN